MKRIILIILAALSAIGTADEITGLNLRTAAGSQAVNPTAVAGAVLTLDANKRPVFSSGLTAPTATGSVTGSASTSFLDMSGTWNTSGTPTGLKLNITDTASNAASLLADFQVGGSARFSLSKSGTATIYQDILFGGGANNAIGSSSTSKPDVHARGLRLYESEVSPKINYDINYYSSAVSMGSQLRMQWESSPYITGAPDLFLGRAAAANLQMGVLHATTPTAQTLKAHDVTTGTGASMTIAGGKGSVAGGSVILATSATNGSPVKRSIVHEGAIGTGNATPVTIATATVDNGKSVGGELLVTVEAEESGHVTTITEHSTFSAVANGGTVTAVIQAAPSTSTAASTNAGTLSLVHGVVPGSNTVAVQVTPTSSYAGPTITIRFQIRFNTSDPGMQVTIP